MFNWSFASKVSIVTAAIVIILCSLEILSSNSRQNPVDDRIWLLLNAASLYLFGRIAEQAYKAIRSATPKDKNEYEEEDYSHRN